MQTGAFRVVSRSATGGPLGTIWPEATIIFGSKEGRLGAVTKQKMAAAALYWRGGSSIPHAKERSAVAAYTYCRITSLPARNLETPQSLFVSQPLPEEAGPNGYPDDPERFPARRTR